MPDYTKLIKKYVKKGFETVTNPKVIKTGVGSMISPGVGSMYKLFETGSGESTSKVSKNTPSQQFTRRSYVVPKPPKISETAKKGTLKPIPSTPKAKQESLKRKDIERNEQTVEKANNDLNVMENYNNSDDNSNSGFNPYKDFGGG